MAHLFWFTKRKDKRDESWQAALNLGSVAGLDSLSRKMVPGLLSIILDRFSVQRNQLLYCGATYLSAVNREQVQDGVQLLGSLVPIVIQIMLDAPNEDWGEIYYPVL